MKKQMNRLLAMALSLILVVSMFPGTALAAGTTIDSIEISNVAAPIPGDPVNVGPTGMLSGADYEIDETGWLNNGYATISGTTFDHSQKYAASFKLVPKSGYTFAEEGTISATINGKAADYISVGSDGSYAIVRIFLYAYPVVTVDNVTISGAVGSAITPTDVIVRVTGGTFRETGLDQHNRLFISNLPAGLTQTVQRVDDTTAKITVAGTPTAQSESAIIITMGDSALDPQPNDKILNDNSNAKFNITGAVSVALTGAVEISGTAKYDETLTAVVSGSNNTGAFQYIWMRSGSAIPGATSETYKVTADDIGKEITVVVTSTVETGSLTSAAVTPEKADAPAAPTGLAGVAPSVGGGNDGKITGVTTAMKWSKNADFSENMWCTGTEITGLTGGTYYVRIAETTTHKASDIVSVIVPGGAYQVNVIDGSADKTEYAPGETVTITAYNMAGKKFTGWTSEDGVTFADATKTTTTFVMPAKDVSVKANFEDLPVTYHVMVVGGTPDKTEALAGETITITAYDAPDGKKFAGWEVTVNDMFVGVELTDKNAATTTFVMPEGDVRVDAVFEDLPATYHVMVVGGTPDKTEALAGETITITAYDAADGTKFAGWTVTVNEMFVDVELADATKATTTFVMPAGDVRVDAKFDEIESYHVTVVGGTPDKYEAAPGETITITAYEAASGTKFAGWTITVNEMFVDVELADATKATTTFVMPAGNVRVDAKFEDVTPSEDLDDIPQTGDSADLLLWGALCMTSAFAVAVLSLLKKKRIF